MPEANTDYEYSRLDNTIAVYFPPHVVEESYRREGKPKGVRSSRQVAWFWNENDAEEYRQFKASQHQKQEVSP